MAHAISQLEGDGQLALNERWVAPQARSAGQGATPRGAAAVAPLCAGCRQKEARYGFRPENAEPDAERPRALCFSCFRIELTRRQAVAARLARSWNAQQVSLPLEETLQELTRRRRRAQIAARHALGR